MPASVLIQYDSAKMDRIRRLLADFPQEVTRFMPRAINRTMTSTRAKASREIKKESPKLKIGDIKNRMREQKASREHWGATLSLSARAISLSRFAYKQNRSGVPVSIQAGRLVVKRAFKMADGGSIFIRNPKGQRQAKFNWKTGGIDSDGILEPRLPISKLFGPSLSALFLDAPQTVSKVTVDAGQILSKNIDREVNYALIRRMPK